MWKGKMAGGGRNKKRIQYCTDSSGQQILSPSSSRSFRTQSHWSFTTRQCANSGHFLQVHLSYWMCNQFTLHQQFRNVTGRTKFGQGKTDSIVHACKSYEQEHKDPETVDLKAPRLARYLQTAWKKHQNTVYWVDIRLAHKKGLKFYQTRSNAIILYNTLPAYCIPKAIKMETGEIIYERVYESPRPPPKISFKDNWMKKLGSEVAGHDESSQQTQPKTPNPIVRTWRSVTTEPPSRSSVHEIDKRSLFGCESTNVSVERSDKDKDADENVDADRVRTGVLVESESRRKFNKLRLDAPSIQHYVIKKGRCHGARHGKIEEQKEYHIAWNAWKRCCKIIDSQGEYFTGIHDRFLRDPVYRESQLAIGWSDQKCKEWDELAKEDHTHKLTPEERRRYNGQRYLTLNKSGTNGPMRLRSDFRAAVSIKNRLHREPGEPSWRAYFLQNNTGTSLNGNGNELIRICFKWSSFSYSWFRLQSIAIHCNRRGV